MIIVNMQPITSRKEGEGVGEITILYPLRGKISFLKYCSTMLYALRARVHRWGGGIVYPCNQWALRHRRYSIVNTRPTGLFAVGDTAL